MAIVQTCEWVAGGCWYDDVAHRWVLIHIECQGNHLTPERLLARSENGNSIVFFPGEPVDVIE